eukprot:Hpha_TRINITY_DN16533_c1_g2::TRINITY_DN16533_c1_g2_i1::g.132480::m.132480
MGCTGAKENAPPPHKAGLTPTTRSKQNSPTQPATPKPKPRVAQSSATPTPNATLSHQAFSKPPVVTALNLGTTNGTRTEQSQFAESEETGALSTRSEVSNTRTLAAEAMGISVIELSALIAGLEGKSAQFLKRCGIRGKNGQDAAGSQLPSEITQLTRVRVVAGLPTFPRVRPGNPGMRSPTASSPKQGFSASPHARSSNRYGSNVRDGETVEQPLPSGEANKEQVGKWLVSLGLVLPIETGPNPVDEDIDLGSIGSRGLDTQRGSDRAGAGDYRWNKTEPYYVVTESCIVRKGIDLLSPQLMSLDCLARVQVARIEGNRALILWPGDGDAALQGWVSLVSQSGKVIIARDGEPALEDAREAARKVLDELWETNRAVEALPVLPAKW